MNMSMQEIRETMSVPFEEFCDMLGYDFYAFLERTDDETQIELSVDQARELGIVKERV